MTVILQEYIVCSYYLNNILLNEPLTKLKYVKTGCNDIIFLIHSKS